MGASLVAQIVKSLPEVWETPVWSLDWEDPWRRKWQPTPVFLSGKSHGQRNMVSHSPWGHKESDMTERLLFLSVDGYLGCFHVLANVNSATMNIGGTCLLEMWFSQGTCLVVGFLGHMVVLLLVFKEISILFSIVVVSIYIPASSAREFPFLHILSSIYCL